MKFCYILHCSFFPSSPPAWWCGLKCWRRGCVLHAHLVTTCVVVWIEIHSRYRLLWRCQSPPAWWCGLKFLPGPQCSSWGQSPPAWWCGLKCKSNLVVIGPSPSPPAWWCGLKYAELTTYSGRIRSPPAWWCGLKSC